MQFFSSLLSNPLIHAQISISAPIPVLFAYREIQSFSPHEITGKFVCPVRFDLHILRERTGRNSSRHFLTLNCFYLTRAPNLDSSVSFPSIWTAPHFRSTKLVNLVCDSTERSSRDTSTRELLLGCLTTGVLSRNVGKWRTLNAA